MENYIVINGEKAELTEEQLKALGIEMKAECKSPYDRVKKYEHYFFVDTNFDVDYHKDINDNIDKKFFGSKNYYNGKEFAEQKALRMKLTNMLEDFSYKNGWKEEYKYDEYFRKYYIAFDNDIKSFRTNNFFYILSLNEVSFVSEEITEQAIKEIVKPFMAEHPELKW